MVGYLLFGIVINSISILIIQNNIPVIVIMIMIMIMIMILILPICLITQYPIVHNSRQQVFAEKLSSLIVNNTRIVWSRTIYDFLVLGKRVGENLGLII